MSSMRPPMLAGPIERQVKPRRSGSSVWWTGGAAGAGGWNCCACMPRTARAHSPAAISPAPNRDQPAVTRLLTATPCLFLEVYFGRGLRRGRRLVIRIFLEAEDLRGHVAGKPAARRVVFLNPLVVAAACGRESILRAGELVHETVELLVRLQVGI